MSIERWKNRAATLNRKNPTKRQIEIAILVSEGKQSKQIAGALGLSSKTVDVHLHNLYKAIAVHTQGEMVRRMIELGHIPIAAADAAREQAEAIVERALIMHGAHIAEFLMPQVLAEMQQ